MFSGTYLINSFCITVLFYRGLAHASIELRPFVRRFIIATGGWVTGIDIICWVFVHRMHPKYSDFCQDLHSPVRFEVGDLILRPLKNDEKTLAGLQRGVPYHLHALIAIPLGFSAHSFLLASVYFLGIIGHPVQGWWVNAVAHWYGYRNLVFGEGLSDGVDLRSF